MTTSRSEALRLYRRILTLHKKKLAPHMRILGDQYVRYVLVISYTSLLPVDERMLTLR